MGILYLLWRTKWRYIQWKINFLFLRILGTWHFHFPPRILRLKAPRAEEKRRMSIFKGISITDESKIFRISRFTLKKYNKFTNFRFLRNVETLLSSHRGLFFISSSEDSAEKKRRIFYFLATFSSPLRVQIFWEKCEIVTCIYNARRKGTFLRLNLAFPLSSRKSFVLRSNSTV